MALRMLLLLLFVQGYDCSAVQGFTMSFGPPTAILGHLGFGGKMSNVIDLYPDGFATPIYGGIVQSTDGGKTFPCSPQTASCSHTSSLKTFFSGFVHYADAEGHPWAHDFGEGMLLAANTTTTSLSSNFTNNYKFVNGNFTFQEGAGPGVSIEGLPIPLCPAPKNFITFYAGGHILLSDGTHLLTGELEWCAAPLPRGRTSLVAFRSKDGYHFEYAANISTPLDIPGSSEGPNEHDLALLPSGDVLCVMRTGAGDGSRGYMPFYKSLSRDGGKTWSVPVAMPGIGCARPHLLQLGKATILSGGRKMMNPEYDRGFDLWMSVDNGLTWEHRSGSYEHNAGRSVTGAPVWSEQVNKTGDRWEFTSGYNGLVRVGESSAMVLYDIMWISREGLEDTASRPNYSLGMERSEHKPDYSFGLEHPEHNPLYSFGMRIDVVPTTTDAVLI